MILIDNNISPNLLKIVSAQFSKSETQLTDGVRRSIGEILSEQSEPIEDLSHEFKSEILFNAKASNPEEELNRFNFRNQHRVLVMIDGTINRDKEKFLKFLNFLDVLFKKFDSEAPEDAILD